MSSFNRPGLICNSAEKARPRVTLTSSKTRKFWPHANGGFFYIVSLMHRAFSSRKEFVLLYWLKRFLYFRKRFVSQGRSFLRLLMDSSPARALAQLTRARHAEMVSQAWRKATLQQSADKGGWIEERVGH